MGLIPESVVVVFLVIMGAGGVRSLHIGDVLLGVVLCAMSVIGLIFMYMTKGTHGDF